MTRPYTDIEVLRDVMLEESYVLDIEAHPGRLTFTVDLVLTPGHERYAAPGPDEQFCYRPATLTFRGVRQCRWSDQGMPPARDATGEIDYGSIDSLAWSDNSYFLEGDWGQMEIDAADFELIIAP